MGYFWLYRLFNCKKVMSAGRARSLLTAGAGGGGEMQVLGNGECDDETLLAAGWHARHAKTPSCLCLCLHSRSPAAATPEGGDVGAYL